MHWILLFLLFFVPAFANGQINRAEKVFRKVNDAIVRIYSYSPDNKLQGQGSGVILKNRRWIITNAHVAGKGKILYAEHYGILFELDSFIVHDIHSDIMVIRIKKSSGVDDLKNVPDIKIFDSDKVQTGQRIYTIGSPLDFENTISEGIVSGIRKLNDDSLAKILQISAPISEGSSGGAVLDAKGRLIGISTSVMSGRAVQNINFAIPINKVFEVVEQSKGKKNAAPTYDLSYKKATEEMEARHYDYAVYYYKQALELSTAKANEKYHLNYMIGRCYLELNELDSAIVHLETAIPSEAKKFCYYYLGKAWMGKKGYEKSQTAFKSAMNIDRGFVEAYNGMVVLYLRQNQIVTATEWLKKAAEVEQANPETMYLTAKILFLIGNYDSAIETLTALIKWKPYYADALYLLSNIYLENGEMEKSFILQQKAFELKPKLRNTPFE